MRDSSNLPGRLRQTAAGFPREMHGVVSAMYVPTGFSEPLLEAADEIERLAAVLTKFVDFEDRYDADKSVTDDEVRAATAEAKALLEGKAP